ncbi:MAG TPA: 5-oxoprolinase subunit PxpB [Chitinophagaceae bacterium]
MFFVSESVVAIDFGNVINEELNKKVIALSNYLSEHPLTGMIEVVPAYSSISIYFDIVSIQRIHHSRKVHQWISNELDKLACLQFADAPSNSKIIRIPVCYETEYGTDLPWIAGQKNISTDEIIRLHTSVRYRVYMLGFLPGFAYMGEADEKIIVPRKLQPQTVQAGSVGITGRQTGVYPLQSPGGWQIIGRTPLKMFDRDTDELCQVKAGDSVEFYSISKDEFENY